MEVLAALGCDAGQGYAIQAPGPAAAIDFAGALRSAPGRAADSLATFNTAHNPLAP